MENLSHIKMENLKIIFMGTPEFGAIVLEKLCQSEFRPVLVVTETDKPVGRKQILSPSPVKTTAQKYNIPFLQPERIHNAKYKIQDTKPDLIVVAAYGQILPKEIMEIPKYGCLNVHPSLLPKYRGPSPIQSAILNGNNETGVTIMLMDDKIDHGGIVNSIKYLVSRDETYETLHNRLAEIGAELLEKTIPNWIEGKIKSKPQDETKATYTKIMKKEDGKIDWTKSADEIERQVRALDSWPSTFCDWQTKDGKTVRIKIIKAGVQKQTGAGPFGEPGKIYQATNEEIAAQTGKDFLIIKELQPEGKKPMSAAEFLCGHPDFVGTVLK